MENLAEAIKNFNAEGGKKGYKTFRTRDEEAFSVRNLDPRN